MNTEILMSSTLYSDNIHHRSLELEQESLTVDLDIEKIKAVGKHTIPKIKGSTTEIILDIIHHPHFRRGSLKNTDEIRNNLKQKISNAITDQKPIEFVLPTLPYKNHNPLKSNRLTPDLGDIGMLLHLNNLCENIAEVYECGAKINLITDGTVYAPLLFGDLSVVKGYQKTIEEIKDIFGLSKNVYCVDMSDLVCSEETFTLDFQNNHQLLKQNRNPRLAHCAVLQNLLKNTYHNIPPLGKINHGLGKKELLDIFLAFNEIHFNKTVEATQLYLSFHLALNENFIVMKNFPEAIRLTCHPKVGQLGINQIHKKSMNYPYHGIGIWNDTYIGSKIMSDVEHNPDYIAVYTKHKINKEKDKPFFFVHKNLKQSSR